MASVQPYRDSRGKTRYRIQYYYPEQFRRTCTLGLVSKVNAHTTAERIKTLVEAEKHGSFVPAQTDAWLRNEASKKVVIHLAKVGL